MTFFSVFSGIIVQNKDENRAQMGPKNTKIRFFKNSTILGIKKQLKTTNQDPIDYIKKSSKKHAIFMKFESCCHGGCF